MFKQARELFLSYDMIHIIVDLGQACNLVDIRFLKLLKALQILTFGIIMVLQQISIENFLISFSLRDIIMLRFKSII